MNNICLQTDRIVLYRHTRMACSVSFFTQMQFEENWNLIDFYGHTIDFSCKTRVKNSEVNVTTTTKKSTQKKISNQNTTRNDLAEALCFDDGVLDLRSKRLFHEAHYKGSTNMTLDRIKIMRCLLPPPGSKLALISDSKSNDLELAKKELQMYGYSITWSGMFEDAGNLNLLVRNDSSSRQLWKPSPLLAIALPIIESRVENHRKLCFLDVGAGAGRDLIFSARRGWASIGVDHLPSHCTRFRKILSILNLEEKLDCNYLNIDVIKHPESLPHADVIHIGRFLHRPLLLHIRDHVLSPGGYFLMHTFMEGCEKFGTPKKSKFMLKHNELFHTFHKGWTILMNEVRPISDGRPLSYFIAVKDK